MGCIRDEVALHRVDAVDLAARVGQRFGKALRLDIAAAAEGDVISAVCELLRILRDLHDRLCKALRDGKGDRDADQHKNHRNDDELPLQNADGRGDGRQTGIQQQEAIRVLRRADHTGIDQNVLLRDGILHLSVGNAVFTFQHQIVDDLAGVVIEPVQKAVCAQHLTRGEDRSLVAVTHLNAHVVFERECIERLGIAPGLVDLQHGIRGADDILGLHAVIEILQKEDLADPEQNKHRADEHHEPEEDMRAHAQTGGMLMLQIYIPFLSA